jgi:ABC-type multidrug transport system fused ATPase/permease subunit
MNKKGNNLKLIWFFLKQYKVYFIVLAALAILVGILETLNIALLYPILSSSLDTQAGNNSNLFFNFINIFAKLIPIGDILITYCILFITFACLVFVVRIIYVILSVRVTSKIVIETKRAMFDKCVNSDYQFFIDNKQGDILYKVSTAPQNITILLTILTNSFVDLLLALSIFSLLLSISLIGSILVIVVGIGYYYVTKYLSLKVSYIAGTQQYKAGRTEIVVLNEFTNGIKQIKVFKTIPYWEKLFENALNTFWRYFRKDRFWLQVPSLMLQLVLFISIASVIIFMKLQNPLDFVSIIPAIGTFAFAIFRILPKVSGFGTARMQLMNIFPNVEAVFELLKDTTYNKIRNGKKEFVSLNSGIELRNVKFAHKNRDILLNNVSLEVNKDNITAIVGASGSGKSTIIDLLLRLYDVDEGGIYINDVNIKEYDISSVLERFGFVSQETFIYNASVKDNIAFGREYTEQEIIESAKLANADEFIQRLPEKYDTIVGDRGVRLSGGEKQRIAIARAMIRKPEILILDEATSSLDNISESIVQKAINKVSKRCTTLVIAHRLSTIQNADIIYVLDQGKIVESGTHRQLMNQKGKYWEHYTIQITPSPFSPLLD